ncbi:MAG: response regulator [Alphaproteobacteria bacterium]|nr:response regulator [Alphaproteobacteria bacterium]
MSLTLDIVDDDEAVRDSTRALLESYGYTVRAFASAEDYLNSGGNAADCLLVDQHMPGMTGLDLLERLHAQGSHVRAIMMTGRSDPTLEPRAHRIGVKLLHKPVEEAQLVRWIENAA